MLSVIQGGLRTYAFFSNLFTASGPDKDIFATHLSPTLRNDIASFVNSHYRFAQLSHQPNFSLQSRFMVTGVGLNKAGMPAKQESLAIWVVDKITLKTHEFVIERVPSDGTYAPRISTFIQCPDSQAVLASIESAIGNMRTMSSQGAESIAAASKTETEAIPLLPLTHDPHTSLTSSPSPGLPITSFFDRAMTIARTADPSLSAQSLVRDSISGCPPRTLVPENCIRRFMPVGLSLFNAVLLAEVVHNSAPIYGLFGNQCYIFASLIFDVIVQRYSNRSSAIRLNPEVTPTTTIPVPAPTPELGAPQNANMVVVPVPDQEDRWSELLILDPIVKGTIVSIVNSKFDAQRKKYVNLVAGPPPGPDSCQ